VIDASPQKILLCMPSLDYKFDAEQVLTGLIPLLAATQGAVVPFSNMGCSNIAAARNACAHHFLRRTDCDTLFFLDTDILFTVEEFMFVLEGSEQVVIAPYARKILGMQPTGFGMGFSRIHRSVFEMLDGMVDEEGKDMLGRYYLDGEIATHYFQTGVSPDARWFGEDTAFWHYCAQAGITQRLERRTRLGHAGRFVYRYPNQIPSHVQPWTGESIYPPENELREMTANGPVEGFGQPENDFGTIDGKVPEQT
jgi:hypothetical protein